MKIPIYHVDAFASKLFSGNPAAVCILDRWLDDQYLQVIAAENNLSETAFLLRRNGELLEMDFPARPPSKINIPEQLKSALSQEPLEALSSAEDLVVVMKNERAVRELEPNFSYLMQIERRGIIVTAEGKQCDFVSRFFAPRVGIFEDPVTGSAHCVLIPYWAERLGKKQLYAQQVSKRGGELFCEDRGERVTIAGKASLYLEGVITI